MGGLGTGFRGIVIQMLDLMDMLRTHLSDLIKGGHRAACEEPIILPVVGFTAASVDTSATPGAGSAPAGDAVYLRGTTLMDLDVVNSGFVSSPAKAGDTSAIEKALAHLIGATSRSHLSASHALSVPSLAGSDDDKP